MSRELLWNPKAGATGQLALESASLVEDGQIAALDHQVREVFLAWREPVYRYLLAVAGSPIDAEDLTQETFIRLFQDLQKERRIENPRAWLFRVAHNLAVDLNRQPYRTRAAGSQALEGAAELRQDPAPSAESKILEREQRERLLARLSPQERRCMELRTEGFRYREIAEILGIRVPTVQTVLGRAIRKLAGEGHV